MKSKKNIQLNAALNTPKSRVKMYKANKIWLFAGALVFMMVGGGSVAYADNATPTSDTPAVTQTTSSSAPSSNIASPASASTELTATPASNSVVAEVNKPASAGSNATSATSSAVVPETKAATSSAATVINQTTKYQTTSGDSIAQSESIDLTNGDYPSFSQPKTVSGYNFDLSNSRFQIVSDGEVAFDGTLSDYAELTNLGVDLTMDNLPQFLALLNSGQVSNVYPSGSFTLTYAYTRQATVVNQTTNYQTADGITVLPSESEELTAGDYPSFGTPKQKDGYTVNLANSKITVEFGGQIVFSGTLNGYAKLIGFNGGTLTTDNLQSFLDLINGSAVENVYPNGSITLTYVYQKDATDTPGGNGGSDGSDSNGSGSTNNSGQGGTVNNGGTNGNAEQNVTVNNNDTNSTNAGTGSVALSTNKDQSNETNSSKLPQTNEKDSIGLAGLGMLMLSLAGMFGLKDLRKKRS
ncbi:hypothetical protein LOOC260_102210 [Paucilactobacillus hokkaidonensis JCM 18461]|uniref:Gram-positive cocci surface proteins LPxTG domain-containing protein n=4 Tax=Paucilactobacillus hokkaidonensis TaxID=1193095 RepID=A0A0A1GUT7_9LACO|nr:KxYKxGKxW signal peptide domain-containing protein [Paucilactobacillus hokkaidonensis]KRO08021.1 hypothetical protein IV59_GL001556 [Paucilactobacillus hokkaidonensis]BAP84799.1 hypothetical protein LOOC260_102210 [Paucilactobacillus hokkaidonensis JCM 18461]